MQWSRGRKLQKHHRQVPTSHKTNPPPTKNDENDEDDVSEDGEQVVTTPSTTSIESRVGNMETILEKVVSVMTDLQTRLHSQNQPPQVSNTDASEPPPTI